ncbi:MAG TPA: glutamate synthase large subunit [Terriglobales bacterium]|nr:glutamate synthase large subunit [Terriglobales bacterium]
MRASDFAADHDACGVGLIVRLPGGAPPVPSREPIGRTLTALTRMAHRGGLDADGVSGDGAGLLTDLPCDFLRAAAAESGLRLPGRFAAGMAFLPPERRDAARFALAAALRESGVEFLGWRAVPVAPNCLGPLARQTMPAIFQFFVAGEGDAEAFETQLFWARKRAEAAALDGVYIASLSARTIVYKGLLAPWQLPLFYPDLSAPEFVSRFAVFHLRYSTNTEPSWRLAQPFRCLAHNGEINTIGGNRRWLAAREPRLLRELGGPAGVTLLERGGSDSASLDNACELELRRGRGAAEALARLLPPAWENDETVPPAWRSWYAAVAREQEPWDGPAALAMSDGRCAGVQLDRNGLRPLRYTRTAAGLLVVGSEAGIADLSGEEIAERGRLGPGEALWVDLETGAWRRPGERGEPPRRSAAPSRPATAARAASERPAAASAAPDWRRAAALGFTQDQYKLLFQPLIASARDAVFSMGDDAPPAMLSRHSRLLWDYCKQRFAQVTNPPIDSLREAQCMSLAVYWRTGEIASPLLDRDQWTALAPAPPIDITFPAADAAEPAAAWLARLEREVAARLEAGAAAIALSDAATGPGRCALPVLLAAAAAWRVMVEHDAYDLPLWVESGQVWDTHHLAMLTAAGATGVYPYLAFALAAQVAPEEGKASLRRGLEAGLKKVLAKMGISTVASYRNSHLFEILGLDRELTERYFAGAPAFLAGTDLDALLAAAVERHRLAYAGSDATEDERGLEPRTAPAAAGSAAAAPPLRDAGLYRYRHTGESHAYSPELIRRFHAFVRQPSAAAYAAYTDVLRERERQPLALRDLLVARPLADTGDGGGPRETPAEILRRFSTQAMSLGALGPEAQRALALAMNRLGGRSNTGEGGEDPAAYEGAGEGHHKIKQVASARFGVTAEYLIHAEELEIKMAQGSKPGEGGQLPPAKVTPYIARLRHAVPGMALISPPPHHDIYSIEDLAQLIHDLRVIAPRARIGVKLVSGAQVGIIAAGVAKAGADVITISGHDGGTGASPLTSIKNTGLPWELGLRDAHRVLEGLGLRARVRLRADGGFKSGRDVVLAALLGADEFGFGTAALVALGCVMARQCHLNTCPAGIATQDPRFRAKFNGRPEMLMAFFEAVAQETRELLDQLRAPTLTALRGRADLLAPRDTAAARIVGDWLAAAPPAGARPAPLVAPSVPAPGPRAMAGGPRVEIKIADRSLGAAVGGARLRQRPRAAEAAWITTRFSGSAGQSFGAFLPAGLRLLLEGEANDYVGKGLSGGEIVITGGSEASRRGDVLAGNTVLYGATAGRVFIAGRAGERFAVRNSGALAVVEGAGHHACEYMTAGVVLILGPCGGNFGAGMTGGLAYLPSSTAAALRRHDGYVRLAAVEDGEEAQALRRALALHYEWTGSPRARDLLEDWKGQAPSPLVRVEPLVLPCSVAATWTQLLPAATAPPQAAAAESALV